MKSILRSFATAPSQQSVPASRYDEKRQVSQILEGNDWIDSWDARSLMGTKKADIETGEDAKGE